MNSCPNINSPEWKTLTESLNEDVAWKTFIKTKGKIVSPLEAAMLIMVDTNPADSVTLLNNYIPGSIKKGLTGTTSVLDLIKASTINMFQDDLFKGWAIKNGFAEKLGIDGTLDTKVSEDQIDAVFNSHPEIAIVAYQSLAKKRPKGVEPYRTKEYPLYQRLDAFLKGLNFDIKTVPDLQAWTGYNAAAATDLIYKTILIANSSNPTELLLRETAYVAYSFLGKKNKVRTDLVNSIENIDNFDKIFKDYKKRSPKLSDYKIKELIVIDFIADAIKNEYEVPSDSYINRKADYWGIKGNNKWVKKFKYYLGKVRRFIQKIFKLGKLSKDDLNLLLKDIAHDVLVQNFQKYGSELTPDQQLTNYEKTIAGDAKAEEIIKYLQKLGAVLTGSLSLRRLGTLYREGSEDLHDIDFSVYNSMLRKEIDNLITLDLDPSYFFMSEEEKEAYMQMQANIAYDKALDDINNISLIKDIKKMYPEFEIVRVFAGLKEGERTITGTIGDYVIDLFLVNDTVLDAQEKGFQDWEPIFVAKIKMGRAKDMRDFANYVPFNGNPDYIARTPGFRHFNFIRNNLSETGAKNVYDMQARDMYREYRKTSTSAMGSEQDINDFKAYVGLSIDVTPNNNTVGEKVIEDIITRTFDPLIDDSEFKIPQDFYDIQNRQRALEIAYKWADKLTNATGIPNERITADVASDMLSKTTTPYRGEPAFFFNGTVYLVDDRINLNNVLHEFGHPIIQMIAKTNRGLFNSLYSQLKMTKEGQAIIDVLKQKMPGVDENSDRFIEEALVTAMGNAAEMKLNQSNVNNQSLPQSTGFAKFVKNLMAAIKKLFRDVFSVSEKVNLDKLSPDTTLDQLGEMLTSKDFVIDSSKVTTQDIAMFATINKEEIDAMSKQINNDDRRKALQFTINEFFDKVRKSKNLVKKAEYKGIREDLVSESGGGLLNKLMNQLNGYSTRIDGLDEKRQQLNMLRDTQNQLQAMVNSVSTLKAVVNKLNTSLKEMDVVDRTDYKSDLNTVYYYKYLLMDWQDFIDEGLKALADAGLDVDSPLVKELSTVREAINQANDHVYNIRKRSSADMIYDTLLFMQENMNKTHLDRMKKLRSDMDKVTTDADKNYILKLMEEENESFKKFQITKDKIQNILSGEVEDLGWWEKELLGVLNISDPVVGAFGLLMKDVYQTARRAAEKMSIEFARDIKDNLEKVGYNPNNVEKFWKEYLFEDTTYDYDANGVLVPKKVLSFLNPLKDYRYVKRAMYADFQLLKEIGTKEQIALKAKEIRNHERKYWHQKYKSEFYEADAIFEEKHGDEAWLEREMLLDQIRRESGRNLNEFEEYMEHDANSILWRKYAQLYSLSYADGTPKQDDDLAKAQLLRRHREATKKFYEWVPIKGGFQNALDNFVSQLKVGGLSDEEIYDMVYGDKGWVRKNTKTAYTEDWYKTRIETLDKIKALTGLIKERMNQPAYKKKLEEAGIDFKDVEALDVSDQYTYIIDLVSGFRNEDGQPLASDMGEKRLSRMYSLQEQIVYAQEKLSIFTGLSVQEMSDFAALKEKEDEIGLSRDEELELKSLIKKKGALPISGIELATLKGLYAELNNIQFREATDNYLDVINVFMKVVGGPEVDKTNADEMLDPLVVRKYLKKDARFKEWFEKNHIEKSFYNSKEGEIESKYERLYAWSVVRPSNEKYIKQFDVVDPITGKTKPILGEPGNKFSYRRVKNEYRTIPVGLTPEQRQNYVGVIIDNMGNYLPKSRISEVVNPTNGKVEQVETAPDDTYVNEKYHAMVDNEKDKGELLDKLRSWHLKFQFGLTRDSKLYMDLPRFRQENLEAIQRGEFLKQRTERLRSISAGVMQWASRKGRKKSNDATREADDFQEGLANAELEERNDLSIIRFMQFSLDDEEGSDRIPIHGIADIPLEKVSVDVLQSLNRYLFSGQQQKALSDINPIIKGLKDVVSDPKSMPKDLSKASIGHKEDRNILRYKTKKGDRNRRRDLMNYMYDREFKGKIYGDEEHLQWFNKFTSMLMKGASFSFFALNIPSGVKNYWGNLWQETMEAIGGHAYNKQVDDFLAPAAYNSYSYGEGKVWAKSAIMDWTTSIFGIKNISDMSLTMQIIRNFDAIQGKVDEQNFGSQFSRTFLKDLASLTFFYSPRKFMEVEAGLQLFGSMMHHQQVEITENGQTRFIPYIDAWELNNKGLMQLKDGIDKGWDMGGEKFKAFVNRVHETSNQLAGAFAKFDQPAAQRNFAYRLWAFMRRWMTSMFMARWGNERYNFGLSNTHEGFYISFLKTMGKIFTSWGKYSMYLKPRERAAVAKILADVAFLTICWGIKSLLFGFDDDDEDRFEKIRNWRDDSPVKSWFGVHLLKLTMATANENSSFIPWFGYGLDDYFNATNVSSVALGPTIHSYGQILTDLVYTVEGNKKARYQRDVGPYSWQKKGSLKVWNHAATIFGLTGKDWAPEYGLQSLSLTENKIK